ncbi:MAG: hypothetical protein LC768_04310 [Acidobacteria bacterium]|nr:hypothetical protein [Acidobacteriota bacterium]MCA1637549.1 hypothetical protein [Acidobacteriota bacterium]
MENKIFMIALMLVCAAFANAQAGSNPEKSTEPKIVYMDLYTGGVSYKTLDEKQVSVWVHNVGNRDAGDSVLKFALTKGDKTITKTVSVGVVKAKSSILVPVWLGENLYLSKFCVKADSTNLVLETNEKNNGWCGEFGGKP